MQILFLCLSLTLFPSVNTSSIDRKINKNNLLMPELYSKESSRYSVFRLETTKGCYHWNTNKK